jgi:hypothetical protein
MADLKAGDLVWANVGEGHDRADDYVATVAKGEYENAAGEAKIDVQDPQDARKVHAVGFRDAKDDDPDRGLTYWLIK